MRPRFPTRTLFKCRQGHAPTELWAIHSRVWRGGILGVPEVAVHSQGSGVAVKARQHQLVNAVRPALQRLLSPQRTYTRIAMLLQIPAQVASIWACMMKQMCT
jgi:hypothetical protein